MKIRRWELVDTKDGEAFSPASRHLFRWQARFWQAVLSPLLRTRFDGVYCLQVRRRGDVDT